jgi:hypothetical protein
MRLTELQLQDQIYALWLPLAITLAFGVVGLIRGVLREAFVAASVVLAALINFQWAGQWGEGLYSFYKGISQREEQFIISAVVLWLIVLVIGYGLGSLLPKGSVSMPWRLLGGMLGLAAGAAVAGWSLRYFITNPDGTLSPGLLVDYPVSRAFMIWAGWFPLVLALVATLLVIMVPLRRAQSAVAQPSAATDWGPSASPTASTMGSMAPTAAMPASAPPHAPAPTIPAARSDFRTEPMHEPDAPATSLLPQSELPVRLASAAPAGSDVSTDGGTATRRIDSISPPAPDSTPGRPDPYATSSFSTGSDSSWLLASTQDERKPAGSGSLEAAPPAPPVPGSVAPDANTGAATTNGDTEKKCANCGAPIASGAQFCTDCGTRVA